MFSNSKVRIISAVMVGSISLLFLYLRGPLLIVLALFFTIVGVIEFNSAYRNIGYNPMPRIAIILTIIIIIAAFFYNSRDSIKTALTFGYIAFIGMMVYYMRSKHRFIDLIITFFSVLYVVLPIVLTIELSRRPDNLMWLVFILAISTDIFAYAVGKLFGKHKLMPEVSPNKTVEGAIGGVLGCLLVVSLFKMAFLPEIGWLAIIPLAIVGSVVSQIGDLTASKIKRGCQIKDFGNIIPGHGGVLDRLDSILFTATVVFIFMAIYF